MNEVIPCPPLLSQARGHTTHLLRVSFWNECDLTELYARSGETSFVLFPRLCLLMKWICPKVDKYFRQFASDILITQLINNIRSRARIATTNPTIWPLSE